MADREPIYDRRGTDRHISALERRIEALSDKLDILDREGSRGLSVLIQRVSDAETRRNDLVASNERAHESLRQSMEGIREHIRHLDDELEAVRRVQLTANVTGLPARIEKVEVALERRSGLLAGMRTAFGVYAAVGLAAAGVVIQIILKG